MTASHSSPGEGLGADVKAMEELSLTCLKLWSGADELARRVKALAAKHEDLSLIPRTRTQDGR